MNIVVDNGCRINVDRLKQAITFFIDSIFDSSLFNSLDIEIRNNYYDNCFNVIGRDIKIYIFFGSKINCYKTFKKSLMFELLYEIGHIKNMLNTSRHDLPMDKYCRIYNDYKEDKTSKEYARKFAFKNLSYVMNIYNYTEILD